MICPDCGELMNIIDMNHMECECGWSGSMKKWNRDIKKSLHGM